MNKDTIVILIVSGILLFIWLPVLIFHKSFHLRAFSYSKIKYSAMKHCSFFFLLALLGSLMTGCIWMMPDEIRFFVNGEPYVLSLAERDTVDLVTLSTEFDAKVAVPNFRQFDQITVDGIPLENGVAEVPVSRIGKDSFLTLHWTCGLQSGTVVLRTLHPKVPPILASGQSTTPGEFYLSFVYLRLIAKYDNDGQLLFYRFEPTMPQGGTDCSGWWDFKKHVVDGTVYYSYHANDPAFADRGFMGYDPGMRILLDENYRKLAEIHLLADTTGIIQNGDPIDGHDFYFFGPGHYIVSAYIPRTLEDNKVYAAYLQEVQDGQVVFDWWSTDHPELADCGDPAFEESADYVHFNSIDLLPDGNWLISLRHISSLLKIDRAGGTGDILWRITGAFHGQHYVRWHGDDSSITLFNNGNDAGRTQMLRLLVDPDSGEVSETQTLLDDGYFAQACGALTFSDGHLIASWGIPGSAAAHDRILTEHDAAGNEVFGLRHAPGYPLDADMVLASYRCVKSE
jgi:hypothetical protein